MRTAIRSSVIVLSLALATRSAAAQEAKKPIFEERAPCAALDAACEQMTEIRAEAARGLPWGTVPGTMAALFHTEPLRGFGNGGVPSASAAGSRAELRRVIDSRDERRVVRLEWRYDYSKGDGRVSKEYAEAEIDSISGAWISARWIVDDPAGRFGQVTGKNGRPACVSWSRAAEVRVLVGGELAKSFSPTPDDSTKWLPWPVAVLSYLATGGAASYPRAFIAPFWQGTETISPALSEDDRGSLSRWSTSLGSWSARRKPGDSEFVPSSGLSGSGTEMERMPHDHFLSGIMDAFIASCP